MHMTHLSDGQLRAHLDGQLEAAGREHLAACPDCRARLGKVGERAARVSAHLAALAPTPREAPRPALAAMAQLKEKEREREGVPTMLQSIFTRRARPIWAGLAVVAALAVAFSFAPVRAWAGQFLGLFRVQEITVLPIDTTRLSELNADDSLGQSISQLFSESVTITKEPGGPQVAASAAEAGQMAGFSVRLPDNQSPTQIVVQDGTAFEVVVDRARAQVILDEAGRSDLKLPASLDGAHIAVDIPTGVSLAFGPCPDLSPTVGEKPSDAERGYGVFYADCVILAQVPSPTVSAPPDLDVVALAQIGLQFAGMSEEDAQAFSQTVDWTSTLVVPIPRNAASVEQVAVDGVTGNLLYRNRADSVPAGYTLLWVKDGVVYALTGFDDPDVGLALANSLK